MAAAWTRPTNTPRLLGRLSLRFLPRIFFEVNGSEIAIENRSEVAMRFGFVTGGVNQDVGQTTGRSTTPAIAAVLANHRTHNH